MHPSRVFLFCDWCRLIMSASLPRWSFFLLSGFGLRRGEGAIRLLCCWFWCSLPDGTGTASHRCLFLSLLRTLEFSFFLPCPSPLGEESPSRWTTWALAVCPNFLTPGLAPSPALLLQSTFVSRSWVGSAMETMVLGGCCAGLAYEIGAAVASCVSGMS